MADNKRSRKYDNLHGNPDYAVICSFLNKFGSLLSLPNISFENLERWMSEQRPISSTFKDFLLSLLKRWRSSANDERFFKYLLKFCESYSPADAAALEQFGFEKCCISVKLRIVKNLIEQQFDTNLKFKDRVNMISADELRVQPIGRDIKGRMYWSFMDHDMNLRIFCGAVQSKVETDACEQKWEIIARNRGELLELIASLQGSDLSVEKLSLTPNDYDNDKRSSSVVTNVGHEIESCRERDITSKIKTESISIDIFKEELHNSFSKKVEDIPAVPTNARSEGNVVDSNQVKNDVIRELVDSEETSSSDEKEITHESIKVTVFDIKDMSCNDQTICGEKKEVCHEDPKEITCDDHKGIIYGDPKQISCKDHESIVCNGKKRLVDEGSRDIISGNLKEIILHNQKEVVCNDQRIIHDSQKIVSCDDGKEMTCYDQKVSCNNCRETNDDQKEFGFNVLGSSCNNPQEMSCDVLKEISHNELMIRHDDQKEISCGDVKDLTCYDGKEVISDDHKKLICGNPEDDQKDEDDPKDIICDNQNGSLFHGPNETFRGGLRDVKYDKQKEDPEVIIYDSRKDDPKEVTGVKWGGQKDTNCDNPRIIDWCNLNEISCKQEIIHDDQKILCGDRTEVISHYSNEISIDNQEEVTGKDQNEVECDGQNYINQKMSLCEIKELKCDDPKEMINYEYENNYDVRKKMNYDDEVEIDCHDLREISFNDQKKVCCNEQLEITCDCNKKSDFDNLEDNCGVPKVIDFVNLKEVNCNVPCYGQGEICCEGQKEINSDIQYNCNKELICDVRKEISSDDQQEIASDILVQSRQPFTTQAGTCIINNEYSIEIEKNCNIFSCKDFACNPSNENLQADTTCFKEMNCSSEIIHNFNKIDSKNVVPLTIFDGNVSKSDQKCNEIDLKSPLQITIVCDEKLNLNEITGTAHGSNEIPAMLPSSTVEIPSVKSGREDAVLKCIQGEKGEQALQEEWKNMESVKLLPTIKSVSVDPSTRNSCELEVTMEQNFNICHAVISKCPKGKLPYQSMVSTSSLNIPKYCEQGSRILAKRKRDFASLFQSTSSRRRGISESELSESSIDSGPEDLGAHSSAPEDGPPTKRQKNKVLLNRFRRDKLHGLSRTKDVVIQQNVCNNFSIHNTPKDFCNITTSNDTAHPARIGDVECEYKEKNMGGDKTKMDTMLEDRLKLQNVQGLVKEIKMQVSSVTREAILKNNQEDACAVAKGVGLDVVTSNTILSSSERNADADDETIKLSNVNFVLDHHAVRHKEIDFLEGRGISITNQENLIENKILNAEESSSLAQFECKVIERSFSKSPLTVSYNKCSVLQSQKSSTFEEGQTAIDDEQKNDSKLDFDGHDLIPESSMKSGTKRPPNTQVDGLNFEVEQKENENSLLSSAEPVAPKKRCCESDVIHATSNDACDCVSVISAKTNVDENKSKSLSCNEVAMENCCKSEKSKTEVENLKNASELEKIESHKKSKKIYGCNEENSTDFVELRRSSRVNKGQRKVEMLELEFPSRRRKKKDMAIEDREKKHAEKERRRTEKMMRQMAEEYEELLQAKKDKKKRFKLVNDDDDNDEDFVPGTRRSLHGKRKKQSNGDDDEDDDNDDSFSEDDEDFDDEYTLETRSSFSEDEVLVLESDGSLYEPTGRNARRVASLKSVLESESKDQSFIDQQCLVCNKKSEPEFMLLCDKCDDGYHTWCLTPILHIIPDGDWFCPPCEHKMLLEKLQEQLCDYDEKAKLNVKLTSRKERLAFINISLNNLLMEKDTEELEKLNEAGSQCTIYSSSNNSDDDEDDVINCDKSDGSNYYSGCSMQTGKNKSKMLFGDDLIDDKEDKASQRDKDDSGDDNIVPNKKLFRRRNRLSSSESEGTSDFDDDDDNLSRSSEKKSRNILRDKSDDSDDGLLIKNKRKDKKKKTLDCSEKGGGGGDDDDEEDNDEVEDDWLVTRRSRRQRKEISYKFEEYENLINGAIEDDIKETYGAGNYGRGKDMANITSTEKNSNSLATADAKRKKKKKKFSVLDSDDDEGDADDNDDESEEFMIDDDDVSLDEDDEEDDAVTELEQSEAEEGKQLGKVQRKGLNSTSRKSKRSKNQSRVYNDYVIEEDDLVSDSKFLKRPPARRAATKKKINYNEYSDDENDDESNAKRGKHSGLSEDSRQYSPMLLLGSDDRNNICEEKRSKKKRGRDEDDDYLEDEDDDDDDEDDFTPGCRDGYSDDDLRNFIKSGSSSLSSSPSSSSDCSSPQKVGRRSTSTTKSQKKKKCVSKPTGRNKRQRKQTGGNSNKTSNRSTKKTKNVKKKRKRKPWYTSDSEEDEEEASITRDSYSDDDFASYTAPPPQKRIGRRTLRYKDDPTPPKQGSEDSQKKLLESIPPSSNACTQKNAPATLQVTAGNLPSSSNQLQNALQPVSTSCHINVSIMKTVPPIPQITEASQRLNPPHLLARQKITFHPSQVSTIVPTVTPPHFQNNSAPLVPDVVTTISASSVSQFATIESQTANMSSNIPLPALQAITTQRTPSFAPHATPNQRLVSHDPFTLSAAGVHFSGASSTTITGQRAIPPLPPLYPIVKNNYILSAPVAMAMRSGMASFGGVCNIAPPLLSQGRKMTDEQAMVNPFNEKLSSFSVRNITSAAPRSFKPQYGAGMSDPMDDFAVQDLDITEFLNQDQHNL